MHEKHKLNTTGRDFIVGDLHGCYNEFQKKLNDVSFDNLKDRVFSVGDLVDRGKDNLKCLKLINKPWFYAVRGNHEDMMIDSVLHNYSHQHWFSNGGDWYLKEKIGKDFQKLVEKVKKLPFAITLETKFGNIGICHAEPPTNDWSSIEDITPHDREKMLWGRTKITYDINSVVENVYATVHGHTPVKHIVVRGNSIYIDGGAVYNGQLIMIDVDNIPEILGRQNRRT